MSICGIYVIAYVYTCVCGYMPMCLNMNLEAIGKHPVSSSMVLHSISETGSLHCTWGSLFLPGWLVNEFQDSTCVHLLSAEITDICMQAAGPRRVLEIQTQVLMFT